MANHTLGFLLADQLVIPGGDEAILDFDRSVRYNLNLAVEFFRGDSSEDRNLTELMLLEACKNAAKRLNGVQELTEKQNSTINYLARIVIEAEAFDLGEDEDDESLEIQFACSRCGGYNCVDHGDDDDLTMVKPTIMSN